MGPTAIRACAIIGLYPPIAVRFDMPVASSWPSLIGTSLSHMVKGSQRLLKGILLESLTLKT